MSSVDSESDNDSSSSSRNGELVKMGFSKKLKNRYVSIKDFKIMLVNGVSKRKPAADCLPEKSKPNNALPSADGDVVADVNDAEGGSFVDSSDKPPSNNVDSALEKDVAASDAGDEVDNQEPVYVATSPAEIDEKCAIDENSFELRIDNDEDDEDIDLILEGDSNTVRLSSDDGDSRKTVVLLEEQEEEEEEEFQQRDLLKPECVVFGDDFTSADSLENITIPDTVNDDGEGDDDDDAASSAAAVIEVGDKSTTIGASSGAAASKTTCTDDIAKRRGKFNCAFCEKTWPNKNRLKFHVLTHLKTFLKEIKNEADMSGLELAAAQPDNLPLESSSQCTSCDYLCVLCEKLYANKVALTIHYKVHHQAESLNKGQPQSGKRRPSLVSSSPLVNGSGSLPAPATPLPDAANSKSVTAARSDVTPSNVVAHSAPASAAVVDAVSPVDKVATSTTAASVVDGSFDSLSLDESGATDDAARQYKCYICDKTFARNSSLMWHIQFHETVMFSKLKKSNSELENGLSPGGGGPAVGGVGSGDNLPGDADLHPFRCNVCGRTYESQVGYRRHKANHGPVDPEETSVGEKCELCNKFCPTAIGLKRHYHSMHKDHVSHLGADEIGGSDVTIDKDGLGANVGAAAAATPAKEVDDSMSCGSATSEYVCGICDRPFTHRSSYKRHMNIVHRDHADDSLATVTPRAPPPPPHPSPSSVRCGTCGKYFSTPSNMRKHAMKYCKGPRATSSATVEDDENVDDGNDGLATPTSDEFKCEICDRLFCSQRAVSIHHAFQHRSADPNANTSSSTSDVTHNEATLPTDIVVSDSYVETEDGDFQCTLCDKSFETRKGVVRHIGYHRSALLAQSDAEADGDSWDDPDDDDDEETEGIPCGVCGKTFESIRGMRIHANSHRLEDVEGEDDDDDEEEEEDDDDNDEDGDDDTNDTSYECEICRESFDAFRSYKAHMGWHSRRGEEASSFSSKQPAGGKRHGTHHVGPHPLSARKIYQCQHCPRWYYTQQALAGHMKVHQPPKPAGGAKFADQSARPPTTGGKTSKTYVCQVCGQHFPSGMGLGGHMKVHTNEGAPVTSPVATTSSTTAQLTLEDTMECDMCGKCFMRKQDMAKHMRDHISGTLTKENVDLSLFRCAFCGKSFVGRKSLNTHQSLHEEPPQRSSSSLVGATNAVSAGVAAKRPASQPPIDASPAKRRLSESAATAAKQDSLIGWDEAISTHQCELCDRHLSTKQSLRRHMDWHARTSGGAPSADAAEVEEAQQLSTATAALQQRAYAVETPFECLYCSMRFASKELLVQHTSSMHEMGAAGNGPAPPPPSSSLVVNDEAALGEHAVVQCVEGGQEEYFVFEQREGEAYQCSECDETHNDKLQMIVHMAYHVGKRWANGRQKALIIRANPVMLAPFECPFCDERFVNKVYRSKHVLKRHRDDVYQCDVCKKVFLRKGQLKAHCTRHASDATMYRCEHCLKCFTSKWFLKRHARKKCAGKSSPEKRMMLPPGSSPSSGASSQSPSHRPALADHKCDLCGLLVNDKEALLGHMQSHALKYKCENCGFGCESILELESHACLITTETVVGCSPCDDETTVLLAGEEEEVEDDDDYKQPIFDEGGAVLCDVCSELFASEKELRSHKLAQHSCDKEAEWKNR